MSLDNKWLNGHFHDWVKIRFKKIQIIDLRWRFLSLAFWGGKMIGSLEDGHYIPRRWPRSTLDTSQKSQVQLERLRISLLKCIITNLWFYPNLSYLIFLHQFWKCCLRHFFVYDCEKYLVRMSQVFHFFIFFITFFSTYLWKVWWVLWHKPTCEWPAKGRSNL